MKESQKNDGRGHRPGDGWQRFIGSDELVVRIGLATNTSRAEWLSNIRKAH
jgi:hypothetical protein